MGLASMRSRVKRIERALRATVPDRTDTHRMVAMLTLLAADDGLWRDWLALCAAPCLDAAGRLAARVNAADPAACGTDR